MSTTETLTCTICDREYVHDRRRGRRPKTCSDVCRRERVTRKQRAHYHAAKNAGLCPHCGGAAAPGRVQCESCLAYARLRHAIVEALS